MMKKIITNEWVKDNGRWRHLVVNSEGEIFLEGVKLETGKEVNK